VAGIGAQDEVDDDVARGMSQVLSPLPGLARFLWWFTHGLRRGLQSFAASRLGVVGMRI
jgi:hypothetical protein